MCSSDLGKWIAVVLSPKVRKEVRLMDEGAPPNHTGPQAAGERTLDLKFALNVRSGTP